MKKTLIAKEVEINKVTRKVAIEITMTETTTVMTGTLGASKFIWKFREHNLPNVQTKGDKIKAARYGRLFIIERLKMEGINLEIKGTNERKVEYVHFSSKNGVWLNVFENGYIRGCIDNVPFVWLPKKYTVARYVDRPGFKGSLMSAVETDRIKARLKEEGFKNTKELAKLFTAKKTTDVDPVEDKKIILVNKRTVTITYHENGVIEGAYMERPEILNGKYTTYKWDSKKQSVNELPKAVKFELRKNFENMNDLIYYANKVFEAGTQRILNLAAVEFKGLQLAETLESIQALIDFRDIKCQLKEDILEHEGLEYRALKKVLAAMETIPVLDGQLSLLGEV